MESGRAGRAEGNNASLLHLRMLHRPIRLHLQALAQRELKNFKMLTTDIKPTQGSPERGALCD